MDPCNCVEPFWPPDELLMKYQYISDFFNALAYFSILLELIYFVKKSAVFPYKWVLVQFGAFIVLCGATHLINLWTFNTHTRTVAIVQLRYRLTVLLLDYAQLLANICSGRLLPWESRFYILIIFKFMIGQNFQQSVMRWWFWCFLQIVQGSDMVMSWSLLKWWRIRFAVCLYFYSTVLLFSSFLAD